VVEADTEWIDMLDSSLRETICSEVLSIRDRLMPEFEVLSDISDAETSLVYKSICSGVLLKFSISVETLIIFFSEIGNCSGESMITPFDFISSKSQLNFATLILSSKFSAERLVISFLFFSRNWKRIVATEPDYESQDLWIINTRTWFLCIYLDDKDNIYSNVSILSCRTSQGDSGIDIMGNQKRCLIIIQCKNYSRKKVEVGEIRTFESILSRYPENTLGVFVTSLRDGYSPQAMDRKESSELNILFTNIYDIRQDLLPFLPKNNIIEVRLNSIEEKLNLIEERLNLIDEKFKLVTSKIKDNQKQITDNQRQMMDGQKRMESSL
ncbi:7456_t:CDS:2, partial [Diversispora eburnea]